MTQVRPSRLLAIAVAVLCLLAIHPSSAQIPDKFTNLKALPKEITKEDLVATMRGFSAALGVRCDHCHASRGDEMDWASDDEPEKQTARVMIEMTRLINSEQLSRVKAEEREHVEVKCRTCHRGQPHPWLIEDRLSTAFRAGGLDSLASKYGELREEYYGTDTYNFGETMLPSLGDALASRENPRLAIDLGRMNLKWFPQSGVAHLMLGWAHARLGEKDAAIEKLRRAVELDEDLKEDAQRAIDRLQAK